MINQEVVQDTIKLSQAIIGAGLAKKGLTNKRNRAENQKYNKVLKPQLEAFKDTHNKGPNVLIKDFLESYLKTKGLNSQFEADQHHFYGQQLVNEYVWASITKVDDTIEEMKSSMYPQLFILIFSKGIKFGFCYGHHVSNDNEMVSVVKREGPTQRLILAALSANPSLELFRSLAPDRYKEEEKIEITTPDQLVAEWSKDVKIIGFIGRDKIPIDVASRVTNVFDSLMDIFQSISSVGRSQVPARQPVPKDIKANSLVDEFELLAAQAGLVLKSEVFARCVASLMAKPFVILTGLSGSGKTKLAQALARWFAEHKEQFKIVPVGADWTSRDFILGYPDALSAGNYRLPSSGILQLLLAADQDWNNGNRRPYFLILDEMNLSHTERYFADILSSMESHEPILLHENKDYPGADWSDVPHQLLFPPNVFVIGTVNVDETTYMFSPKVLDRASVIEFLPTREEISQFLDTPHNINLEVFDGKGAKYGKNLVEAINQQTFKLAGLGHTPQTESVKERAHKIFLELFEALKSVGSEYGFRPAHEMSRFVYFHSVVSGDGWKLDAALDAAVLQKLLPKLHGSTRKLAPVLEKLENACQNYPASLDKINRMKKRLEDNGFTSFAEA